ncbi:mRNA-decapping enzyme subunit 2 [Coniothyrium glycines]
MTHTKMTLVDWLDDLCVRFIVNLPNEELQSVERICFQIEEAQWFYEDFIRPLDPNNLPSMHLRKFSQLMFQHCPLFSAYSEALHQQAYEQFLAYKTRVPVRGAIMLNEEMTHAVLVKGWKKGAKWSFPRGKINKEEADLDCAIREVWEETGYDLKATDLVLPDDQMKKITVTMREQSMMLYVFRGVPMDTHFEPRTRKEISKIDWYKLTDLPTLRRKNQVQQQTVGQDLIKESSFYMVAPFLGPLRAWIKQQHKLDKHKARHSAHLVPPPVAMTDDEDLQAEKYEAVADEGLSVTNQPHANNFANLVAQLTSDARSSDNLPELPPQSEAQHQPVDPAIELKRLLSVGVQSPQVEAPSNAAHGIQSQANPLLALFKQGNSQPPPQTPFDQLMSPAVQPSSPHGQHQPRPPQMHHMPPPPFPFPHHGSSSVFHGTPQQFNAMSPQQIPPQFMQSPHHASPGFHAHQPSMQQAFDERNPRPFQTDVESHFAGGQGRPTIPSASNLPAPKLTAHTLGLLNSFKANDHDSQPPSSQQPHYSQMVPESQFSVPQHRPHDSLPPPGAYTMSPPQYKSLPVSASFEPEQPKPRTIHQDSLLTLFRGTPPIASPEPAELSAHPLTPGFVSAQPVTNHTRQPDLGLLDSFGKLPTKSGATSATVSGPVNAPDFDTMKKHTQPISGSSRGPSPAIQVPFKPQQILKRTQASPASQAPMSSPTPSRNETPSKATTYSSTPQASFKPQILKRPQQHEATASARPSAHAQGLLDMFKGSSPQVVSAQPALIQPARSPAPSTHARGLLDMFRGSSPQPAADASRQLVQPSRSPAPSAHAQGLLDMFKGPSPQSATAPPVQPSHSPAPKVASSVLDRRESLPSEQKSTLLALFSKTSPNTRNAIPLRQPHGPYPPTPKTAMSGVISPVSPLPINGSQATSPANNNSRSRISSIGDAAVQGIVIPPTSHPVDVAHVHSDGGLTATQQEKDGTNAKSPVDKTFLLGFLEDVARRGR